MSHSAPPPFDPAGGDPKAQAKAAKAYAKATRPWYKKKRFIIPIVLLVLGGIGAVSGGGDTTSPGPKEHKSVTGMTAGGDTSDDSSKGGSSNPDDGVFEITVTSTGSSSANSITFMQPDGNFEMSQENGKPLPWTKRWTGVDSIGIGWNMNAQQNGGGDLKCVVKHNGKVIAENSSSGNYAMVTCTP